VIFKQFYLGCLAHASYLIGSEGEAAVIDPQRDVDQYIDEASAAGLKIKYVIETHFHADFVSGHRELAARTGAEIVFGRRADPAFPFHPVGDGDELRLGDVRLRFIETPGHTPEGISILAVRAADPTAVQRLFTGDTLFIGDVGRPDLIGSKGFSAEQMAAMLYDSLHDKLLGLPDAVEVYPAHGAGSLCGRNMSRETMSTIGEQRKFNYALQPMAREAFVAMMTTDLPEAPAYFSKDAELNRTGAGALDDPDHVPPLPATEVADRQRAGALVLDVRGSAAYGAGHIAGAINIGLGGQFASWAGSLISMGTRVILVAEDQDGVSEALVRLARVGIESVEGYLDGGVYSWYAAGLPTLATPQMPVDELHARIEEGAPLRVLDVRRAGEYASGHVPGAVSIPLSDLKAAPPTWDPAAPTAVVCGSGYRSSAGTSILETLGFQELYNVVGGTAAWTAAGYPVETPA